MLFRIVLVSTVALVACGGGGNPLDAVTASGSGGGGSGGSSGSATASSASSGSGAGGPAPGTTWFHEPFEDLGAQNMYGFGNRYPQSSTTWETQHLPAGGWNGSGAAHVTLHGCEGCTSSLNQFNTGWVTPELASLGKPTSTVGDHVYIRFRIRFDDDHRWEVNTPNEASAKFVLFGDTGGEPNSRIILHLFNPYENGGCSLGFDYGYTDPPYAPSTEWVTTEDWGLGVDGWEHSSIYGSFGAFTAHVNISWDCAPGVLVTYGNNPSAPAPQHRGAAPVDGWYSLQFYLKSGTNDDAELAIWANNDDFDNPSSRRTGINFAVAGWDGGVNVGGYWGIATGNTMGYVIDDVEVGDSFHPDWHPDLP